MGSLLRRIQRFILGIALAGLALTATAAPTVHAASGPSLYLIGQGGNVYVSGQGFTPGVQARVEVLNSSLTIVGSTQYLTPTSCYYGGCFATVLTANFTGSAWVAVDQAGWTTTWGQTTIYQDPYITAYTESGPSSTTFAVSGSGYTPSATVTVQAWQWQWCGRFLCTKVLSSQTVTASFATSSNADYGLIYGNVTVPAHSGLVFVSTTGGAPAASNVVSFNIP